MSRRPRIRPWPVMVAVSAGAIVIAFLVPDPFVRGLVIGFILAPALFLGVIAVLSRRLKRRLAGDLEPPPLPIESWDYGLAGLSLDGNPVNFSTFTGDVLVLNVWATWCVPCISEMPSLARLRAAVGSDGVRVACVTDEPFEKVERFVSERGIQAPVYVIDQVPASLSAGAIPATYVLDREGRIAFRHVGAAAWDDPTVLEFVRRLASSPKL